MTDYELLDLMEAWYANVGFAVMSMLVLFIAYLCVAYFAGRMLSRVQVVIVTCVMLWFSFIIVIALYTSLQTLIELRELGGLGYTVIRRAIFFKWLILLGCSVMPLICIKFMYHVRHPPFERRRPLPRDAEP